MPKSRIILMVLLAVAAILAIQNWSGAISLVFLGMKTAPLPLSAWILLGVAAGALTSGLISTFAARAGSTRPRAQPRHRPPETPPPEGDRDKNRTKQSARSDRPIGTPIQERQQEERQQEERRQENPRKEYRQDREYEQGEEFADEPRARIPKYPDYDEEPWDDEEDWLPEPEERFSYEDAGREPGSGSQQNFPNRRKVYEMPQEPIGENHSGSMYSYTYKNKDNSNSDREEKKSTYDPSNLEEGTTESRHQEVESDAGYFYEEDILETSGDSDTSRREFGRETGREPEYDRAQDSEAEAREPARDSESGARDAVQDANYRVIEAPAQPIDLNGKQAAPNRGDDDWEKKQYNNGEW